MDRISVPTCRMSSSSPLHHDCTSGCNSSQHKDSLTSCVTRAKDSQELLRWFTCICSTRKPFRIKDGYGRSGLHFAASLGRTDTISLYLRQRGAVEGARLDTSKTGINEQDAESGWSPLHRAVFHGEIESAALLARNGAELNLRDHDGYTAAQLLLFDMGDIMVTVNRSYERPEECFPVAFFSWGSNMNFTLGCGDDHERNIPDRIRAPFPSSRCIVACPSVQSGIACTNCGNSNLEALRSIAKGEMHLQSPSVDNPQLLAKNPKSTLHTIVPKELAEYRIRETIPLPVIDIVLRKFHTLFLTPEGVVFACGHGRGGRLGLPVETTYLNPTRIAFQNSHDKKIVAIAAGLNHSVFLSSGGTVYTCGSNEFFQLGINNSLTAVLIPTEISPLPNLIHGQFKRQGNAVLEVKFVGIAAERCHTLVWTKDSLYACGYNGGQLGSKPDRSGKSLVSSNAGKSELSVDLVSVVLREITEVKSLLPARFVRCSDAAVLICGAQFDISLLHEYGVKRLGRLPRLSRIMPDQFYRLVELCIFGGNLDLPGKETALRRSLVITALVSDVPLLYIDSGKGSWLPISLQGIPRDMDNIYHMSVSADTLLLCTQYGECYKVKLSNPERRKSASKSEAIASWHAERIPRLHRAVKVFAEPGGRNFSAIQVLPPYHFEPCITSFFDNYWVGESRNFSQESSPKPNVRVVFHELSFGAERLFLITGSRWLRKQLLKISPNKDPDDQSPPVVLDVSATTSLDRLHADMNNAYHLREWSQIQKDFYSVGTNLWDVEPDMQICCDEDGTFLNCHRWVLITRVLYFSCLLEGNRWKDSMKDRAPVLPCSRKIGQSFLEFIYTGSMSSPLWNWNDCMALLRLADFLVDEKMRTEAAKYFKPSFNSDQVWSLYGIAELYNSLALKKECLEQMSWMLPDLLESKQLETLDEKALKMLTKIYKEKCEFLAGRTITPYDIPEINYQLVNLIHASDYPVDNEPDSSESQSSRSKGKKHARKHVSELNNVATGSSVRADAELEDARSIPTVMVRVPSSNENRNTDTDGMAWRVISSAELKSKIGKAHQIKAEKESGDQQSTKKPFGLDTVPSTVQISSSEMCLPSTRKLSNTCGLEDEDDELPSGSLSSSPSAFKVDSVLRPSTSGIPSSLSSIFEEQRRHSSMQIKKIEPVILKGAKNPHHRRFVGQKLSFDDPEVPNVSSASAAETTPPKRIGNPWVKVHSAGGSLSSIIAQEAKSGVPHMQPSTSNHVLPKLASGKEQKVPSPAKPISIPPSPSSWTAPSAVLEPISSPVDSFQQILRDEKEQLAQLQKSRSRPMPLIQIEERAVEELLQFYGAEDNPEEWISVVRAAPKEAPVSWSARAFR